MQDNGNLSLLESLGIKPSYMDLYAGLQKGWTHERKIYDFLNRYTDGNNEDLIINIYLAEHDGFAAIVESFKPLIERVYGKENIDESYSQSIRKWQFAFLISILISGKSEDEMNNEILSLDYIFNYPPNWESFIIRAFNSGEMYDKISFEILQTFLRRELKEIYMEFLTGSLHRKLSELRELANRRFYTMVLREFFFLAEAGYADYKMILYSNGRGVEFSSGRLKRKVTISRTDAGDLFIRFFRTKNKIFRKTESVYISDWFPEIYKPEGYLNKNRREWGFKENLRLHAMFIRENLTPVIRGEKWFDEL